MAFKEDARKLLDAVGGQITYLLSLTVPRECVSFYMIKV